MGEEEGEGEELEEEDWRPGNDTDRFYGPTRLREALAHSRNVVAVRLLNAVGVGFTRRYCLRFGFAPDTLPPNLSLALGTASVTPLEQTAPESLPACPATIPIRS